MLASEAGLGDFISSLGGSIASMYTSDALADTFGSDGSHSSSLSSLGHISESRNSRNLEIELVGFNHQQFNHELQQINKTLFEENAIHREVSTENPVMQIDQDESESAISENNVESEEIVHHYIIDELL
ncbi:MAG: hypothetical protein LBJ45_01705 [Holosporaceae bacterium]|jgi:hypothetical protein|nr:hypothetical protein [Holosporaceae bacterium]